MSESEPLFKLPIALPIRQTAHRSNLLHDVNRKAACSVSSTNGERKELSSPDTTAHLSYVVSPDGNRSLLTRKRIHDSEHCDASVTSSSERREGIQAHANIQGPRIRHLTGNSSIGIVGECTSSIEIGRLQRAAAGSQSSSMGVRPRYSPSGTYVAERSMNATTPTRIRHPIPSPCVTPILPQKHYPVPGHGRMPVAPAGRSLHAPLPKYPAIPLPYTAPEWSSTPPTGFSFEIIKEGMIIGNVLCVKPFLVIGRLPNCDVQLEHPSVSRYHAIIQYCKGCSNLLAGFYIYDLASTHGTLLNKEQLKGKIYSPLKNGYVIKFGMSTRLFAFQGPPCEEVVDVPATPARGSGNATPIRSICDWGMREDAEEEDLTENPFAMSYANEDLYLTDPRKALRGWFEREGCDLQYKIEEKGMRNFVCSVQLPIDTPNGEYLKVEASVMGKKRESIVACALEACRTLDSFSLLCQPQQQSQQPKKKKWEEDDFYDSDEDPFLDRTGTLEKKREWRKKLTKSTPVENYESLVAKLSALAKEIGEIEGKLGRSDPHSAEQVQEELDPLDSYMMEISDPKKAPLDPVTKSKLRNDLAELKKKKKMYEEMRDAVAIPKKVQSKPTSEILIVPKRDKSCSDSDDDKPREPLSDYMILQKEMDRYQETLANAKKSNEQSEDGQEEQVASEPHMNREPTMVYSSIVYCPRNNRSKDASTASCSKRAAPTKASAGRSDEEQGRDADYSMWLPPKNQSGDGTTHLNERYGY